MDNSTKIFAGTSMMIGIVCYLLILGFLRVLVFRDLWAWFVVPLGVPSIGLIHAIGLIGIVLFLTPPRLTKKEDRGDVRCILEQLGYPLINTLVCWVFGALFARFV